MNEHFYRFRPIDALLGKHEELDKQEIYFAPPHQLNDPMEGFKDLFWSGDLIIWTNFLKHYVRSLNRACSLLMICGEQEPIDWDVVSAADLRFSQNRTNEEDKLVESIFSDFLTQPIKDLLLALAQRTSKIRRDELITYIKWIHIYTITTIYRRYQLEGLAPLSANAQSGDPIKNLHPQLSELVRLVERAAKESEGKGDAPSTLFQVVQHLNSQISISRDFGDSNLGNAKNKHFIFHSFPDQYINHLERLLYPDWYTACFMSDCRNASLWGYYGDNHKGACLIFKPGMLNGTASLSVTKVTGWGNKGPHFGEAPMIFRPVSYTGKHVEIDFFRSLGRLPISTLSQEWYCGPGGEKSVCSDEIFSDEAGWQNRYWERFEQSTATKLKDWNHENEHRLVLHSNIADLSDVKCRLLKYNFHSLAGIIFGIKTSSDDKMKILKIIEEKCNIEQRKDFKFYQAYFSPHNGKIEHAELPFLKFTEKLSPALHHQINDPIS